MKDCRNVQFLYKNKEYYAIVRHRQVKTKGFYHIRIMNHKLDSLLNKGNQSILQEEDGNVLIPEVAGAPKQSELLRIAIVNEIFNRYSAGKNQHRFGWIRDYNYITPF